MASSSCSLLWCLCRDREISLWRNPSHFRRHLLLCLQLLLWATTTKCESVQILEQLFWEKKKSLKLTCHDNWACCMVPYFLSITFVRKAQVNGTIASGQSTIFCLAVNSNWRSLDTKFLAALKNQITYVLLWISSKQRIVWELPSQWNQSNHAWSVHFHRIQKMTHWQDRQWSKH